jgi:hypothetical protein
VSDDTADGTGAAARALRAGFDALPRGAPLAGEGPLVDVHAHFYHPRSPRGDWAAVNLARLRAGERIGITCHVASVLGSWGQTSPTYFPSPEDVTYANDVMLAIQRALGHRVRSYAAVNPNFPELAIREIERCAAAGAVGVKLAASRRADDPLLDDVAAIAAERGLPILHHIWQWRRRDWPMQEASDGVELGRLAARHPRARFILAHIGGGGDYMHTFHAVAELPNVWLDLSGSGVDRGMLDGALAAVGAGRLLWACDVTIETGLAKLRALDVIGLSAEDRARVRWRNAYELFPPGAFEGRGEGARGAVETGVGAPRESNAPGVARVHVRSDAVRTIPTRAAAPLDVAAAGDPVAPVDVNTWIGAYPFRHLPHPEPAVLARVLQREGVAGAWVGHLPSAFHRDPAPGNAELHAALAPFAGTLRPVPCVRPDWPRWERLLRDGVDRGAPAVRAYPSQWGMGPGDPGLTRLAAACAESGLALLLTVRFEDLRQRHPLDGAPDLSAPYVRAIVRGSRAQVVVVNAGRELIEETFWSLTIAERERLWFDFSWVWGPPEDQLATLFRSMGAERFVFGTGWPLRLTQNPTANLALLPDELRSARVSDGAVVEERARSLANV